MQILDGSFTVNGDRAVLIPRKADKLPDYRYLARVLEQRLRPMAVGRVSDFGQNEYTKLRPNAALAVTIPFILDEEGRDDFPAMKRIGDVIERSKNLQANLMARANQICDTNIVTCSPDCYHSEVESRSFMIDV